MVDKFEHHNDYEDKDDDKLHHHYMHQLRSHKYKASVHKHPHMQTPDAHEHTHTQALTVNKAPLVVLEDPRGASHLLVALRGPIPPLGTPEGAPDPPDAHGGGKGRGGGGGLTLDGGVGNEGRPWLITLADTTRNTYKDITSRKFLCDDSRF